MPHRASDPPGYPAVMGEMSAAQLDAMVEEATVDCCNEAEQATGLFTMIDEHLATPFDSVVMGLLVTVEGVDLDPGHQIVAVCARDGHRQNIPILDLPVPWPSPEGAEWVAAYRHWLS